MHAAEQRAAANLTGWAQMAELEHRGAAQQRPFTQMTANDTAVANGALSILLTATNTRQLNLVPDTAGYTTNYI